MSSDSEVSKKFLIGFALISKMALKASGGTPSSKKNSRGLATGLWATLNTAVMESEVRPNGPHPSNKQTFA